MCAAASVDLAALRVEAAMRGEPTIGRAIARRARERMERSGAAAAPYVWRTMPDTMRELLLTMATERKVTPAVLHQPWEAFSDAERLAIGSTARQWARELDRAGMLR